MKARCSTPASRKRGVHVIAASPDLLGYDEATRSRVVGGHRDAGESSSQGVERASLALFVPLGSRGDQLNMAPADRRQTERPFAYNIVRPGYFGMLGVRLVAGRDLSPNDSRTSPDVVVVSQAMARRFFDTENAVGRSVRLVDRAGQCADRDHSGRRSRHQDAFVR